MVDAKETKRVELTSGVKQTIDFDNFGREVSLSIIGSGTVAYKINGTLVDIDDDEANILNADVPAVDIVRAELIETIEVISDASISLQWEGAL